VERDNITNMVVGTEYKVRGSAAAVSFGQQKVAGQKAASRSAKLSEQLSEQLLRDNITNMVVRTEYKVRTVHAM
jgi:hypothetical protein